MPDLKSTSPSEWILIYPRGPPSFRKEVMTTNAVLGFGPSATAGNPLTDDSRLHKTKAIKGGVSTSRKPIKGLAKLQQNLCKVALTS